MSRKRRGWWAGMYEGKTPEEVREIMGLNAPKQTFLWGSTRFTPRSMRSLDPKTAALRKDGKLCGSLNGL